MEHILHCILSILAGVLGVSLTIFDLPGNTFMLLSTYAFALLTEHNVSVNYLLMITLIYLAGELWESGMSFFGIKKEKVSWFTVFIIAIGGFIGTAFGTGVFPILGSFVGGLIGAFLAAFAYTYFKTGNRENATYIAWQAAKVRCLAMLGKLTAGFALAILLVHLVVFR